MINSIAEHHTNELDRKVKQTTERNLSKNTKEHNEMIEKFEKEMLIVSNYCKA